ncbi:MAG TPA: DUF535 family protein [Terracidiphilus sp.]|nr:DUF535 family protein [Terracidiphilus sp.]
MLHVLVPILRLTKDAYYWNPPRLARIVWAVASNSRWQIQIFKLLASPPLKALVFIDPRIAFKYLSRDHLARGLDISARAACFMHHYNFLRSKFPSHLLRQVIHREATLLDVVEDGKRHTITMGLSRQEVREGELFLHQMVDGVKIFVMQFTIVPGRIVGSCAENVILVSRLQGMKGCFTQVHAATKAFRDVAPPALLMSALQGIAEAFGIREMAGVNATRQFSYVEDHAESFLEAYDRFFDNLGATLSHKGFFTTPLPLEEKSLHHIKNGHKSRTRKKRAFKLQIAERVCEKIQASA